MGSPVSFVRLSQDGLKPSKIVFFMYGLKPVPFNPSHNAEFFRLFIRLRSPAAVRKGA